MKCYAGTVSLAGQMLNEKHVSCWCHSEIHPWRWHERPSLTISTSLLITILGWLLTNQEIDRLKFSIPGWCLRKALNWTKTLVISNTGHCFCSHSAQTSRYWPSVRCLMAWVGNPQYLIHIDPWDLCPLWKERDRNRWKREPVVFETTGHGIFLPSNICYEVRADQVSYNIPD